MIMLHLLQIPVPVVDTAAPTDLFHPGAQLDLTAGLLWLVLAGR